MKPPLIRVECLTRELPHQEVPVTLVKNISFEVGKGELLAITGPSGSGKSSLIYLLGLLDNPTRGTIWLNGINTTLASDREKERLRLENIGFVFQFHFLLQEFTVIENILLPMRKLGHLNEPAAKARALELLAYFGLKSAAEKRPYQLSGGERQRVAIARAMANNPLLIIADEPTGNLDSHNSSRVFDLFLQLIEEHRTTILMVTHDKELANRATRRLHLVDGALA